MSFLSTLLIFAGGKGSRLSELTTSVPKPAVDVQGKPLISYVCDWAFTHGLATVLIAAGYKQAVLKRRLLDHYQLSGDLHLTQQGISKQTSLLPEGCEIIIRDTGVEAETAERLFAMRDLVQTSTYFMVTYGDTLTDLDPSALIETAIRTKKRITMCIGHPDARYGEVITEGELVRFFQEKKAPQFLVNRGFFVIKSNLFDVWQPHFKSFEHDVIPYFVAQEEVAAYQTNNWFHSVDSLKDLAFLEEKIQASPFLVKDNER